MKSTTIRIGAVTCSACGRKVRRAAHQQLYCSGRCRQRAHWERRATAKISALPTHHTGRLTNSPKNVNRNNSLQGEKSRPSPFAKAPLNVLGGGWHWPDTPRLDRDLWQKILRAEIGGNLIAVPQVSS
jgi:hypothetical protein